MTEKPTFILYHKHCVDGTAAAAVVLQKFPDAKMIPLGHDTKEADLRLVKDVITSESSVVYVDTSTGLEEIVELVGDVLVLDHHISEKEKVEELVTRYPKITYVFDNDESGATLAFKYLFPEEDLPKWLPYVRDIDLWKNELQPESGQFHQYLSTLRNRPELLLSLFEAGATLDESLQLGKVLLDFVQQEVELSTKIDPLYLVVSGHKVPAFNITNHQSKTGNVLVLKNNSVVVMYTILGDKTRFSIRSAAGCTPSALDVAKFFGGGGHEHTSGATVDTKFFLHLLLA